MISLKSSDEEAWEVLVALVLRAQSDGLPDDQNGDQKAAMVTIEEDSVVGRPRTASYKAPVGLHVPATKFTKSKPMPWLGELMVEGSSPSAQVDHRLYFIEGRPDWDDDTDVIVASKLESKGVGSKYSHSEQTTCMCDAMHSGIGWCLEAIPTRAWRVWTWTC